MQQGFGTAGAKHRQTVPPIVTSSTFVLDSAEHGARLCEHADPGVGHSKYLYTRWGNPSSDLCSEVLKELEGGAGSLFFSSGMAAINAVLFGVLRPGDHLLLLTPIYSGTHELATTYLREFGVEVSFAKGDGLPATWREMVRPGQTKMIYCETPANPLISLVDLNAVAELAQEIQATSVVDSTFACPYNQLPLSFGIDVSLHSATKYLGGHSDLTAGALTFRTDSLCGQVANYHRLTGPILSAFDAFLLQRSFRSLAPRMRLHNSNAQAVAEFLAAHVAVALVHYPGLPAHPQHELARRQMRNGFGGMVSFEVRGGLAGARILLENLSLITLAVSLGGAESLIEHPASMTHAIAVSCEFPYRNSWLSHGHHQAIRAQQGISDGLVRLSVGLEDAADLIADLRKALDLVAATLA